MILALSLVRGSPVTMNMNANSEIGDHLDEIYDWIDQIKFSRPKKNIARDFSDGGNEKGRISPLHKSIRRFFTKPWRTVFQNNIMTFQRKINCGTIKF